MTIDDEEEDKIVIQVDVLYKESHISGCHLRVAYCVSRAPVDVISNSTVATVNARAIVLTFTFVYVLGRGSAPRGIIVER